jgi:hypothetical protein
MASLDRAVTLVEVNVVSVMVSKDLYFNVTGRHDVLFKNTVVVSE